MSKDKDREKKQAPKVRRGVGVHFWPLKPKQDEAKRDESKKERGIDHV
jgi:hypothetical protein